MFASPVKGVMANSWSGLETNALSPDQNELMREETA